MAVNFAGGTDRCHYNDHDGGQSVQGCYAFWLKTSQATVNACPVWCCATGSNDGLLFLLNNVANKISMYLKISAGNSVLTASTTSINNGAWHHVACNWMDGIGNPCELFINGTQEASTNHSRAFTFANTNDIYLGDPGDTFWGSYVGELAELGVWTRKLQAGEIAALAKGFSPALIAPDALYEYVPLVRSARSLTPGVLNSQIGTSVVSHPRVLGGMS